MVESAHKELQWSVAQRPMPGEKLSGDDYLVRKTSEGWLLAVVDGLGHGAEAAAAARTLIRTFADHAETDAVELVRLGHEALKDTRGSTCALAVIDSRNWSLGWIGIGNVEGVIHSAHDHNSARYITMRGGIVGYRLPNLQPTFVRLADGDLLVMATDGIDSDFLQAAIANQDPERLSAFILDNYAKPTDDALVLVACWRPQYGQVEEFLK